MHGYNKKIQVRTIEMERTMEKQVETSKSVREDEKTWIQLNGIVIGNKSQKGVDDDPFNALSLSVIISITFQFNFKVEIYEYWSPLKNSLFQRWI